MKRLFFCLCLTGCAIEPEIRPPTLKPPTPEMMTLEDISTRKPGESVRISQVVTQNSAYCRMADGKMRRVFKFYYQDTGEDIPGWDVFVDEEGYKKGLVHLRGERQPSIELVQPNR